MTVTELSELGRLIPESFKAEAAEAWKLAPKAGRVDSNAMEVWLNQTLAEAGIASGEVDANQPISLERGGTSALYGIDRLTLLNSGLSQSAIE